MIRYRLAQSNVWVYTVQKTSDRDDLRQHDVLLDECICELQAWIMKMDETRECVPKVETGEFYDYRNHQWSVRAKWKSPKKLHDEGEAT